MQILTGELKGRKIRVPKGNTVRPTSGRIKKSLFDTIGEIEGNIKVLDIFSGSGGLGLECLSRGAVHVVFIEKNRHVAKILSENIKTLGLEKQAEIMGFDYIKALSILSKKSRKFDLILIDPPYSIYRERDVAHMVDLGNKVLGENGMIVVEHNTGRDLTAEGFAVRTKKYGETLISFFRRNS